MVTAALDEGFRHIDTAQAYNNETQIGEGIRRADTRRADVFLTTKILSEYFAPEAFLAAAAASLSSDEIAQIDALGVAEGRLVNPETLAPEWD
jgi:diketogulonate reductase-like aldo/keto reductase